VLRESAFDHRPIDERSVVDQVALEQVFVSVLQVSPVSIIPPRRDTNLNHKTNLIRSGRSLGTFKQSPAVPHIEVH
jgi:hypothetical protein